MICAYIHDHTHKYLGMATSDRNLAQTLRLLLGQIERRILLFCCPWLTYSTFIRYLFYDCRLALYFTIGQFKVQYTATPI